MRAGQSFRERKRASVSHAASRERKSAALSFRPKFIENPSIVRYLINENNKKERKQSKTTKIEGNDGETI